MNKRMETVYKIPVYFISFFILIFAAGCTSRNVSVMPVMQNNADLSPKEHKVLVVETRTLDKYLNVNATVSYDDLEELSFKIDYYKLKAIYVSKDEQVEEGQLLAELDASDLEYRIAAKQIDLKRVQLRYDKILSEPGMEPADKNTELEILELDMESIELEIAHIEDLISKTQLLAPFSGVITTASTLKPGSPVFAYETFMTIWKPDSVMLISDILNPSDPSDTSDLSGIVTGMKVVLIYGSKDTLTEIPATITKIINTDPGVLSNSNRMLSVNSPFQVTVKPDVANPDLLNIDRTLTLRIKTGTLENVVVLPKSIIHGFGKEYIVKVAIGDKIINRRIIAGYVDVEEDVVAITSGLRPGESILLN